jgi:hypothetical protein
VTDPTDTPPRCAHCDQPIGVYEPLIYEDDAGVPVESAYLRLPPRLRHAHQAATYFHVACFAAIAAVG